jgi:hypothetical protein
VTDDACVPVTDDACVPGLSILTDVYFLKLSRLQIVMTNSVVYFVVYFIDWLPLLAFHFYLVRTVFCFDL